MASSRRCVTSSGAPGRIDQPDPLRLLGGDQAEGELDLVVIIGAAAADPVASASVARSGPLAALVEHQHQGAVGKDARRCAKALIARTASIPRPPAPP